MSYVPATYPDIRFINFLDGNDAGDGSFINPWKTLQHAYNSITPTINRPFTFYLSGGNNDTDGAVTAKPNVSLMADYPIQVASGGFTISGGTSNDSCTFTNIIFLGAFSWIRNDVSVIGLGITNTEFFSGPTFQQNGSGSASITAENSVFVNANLNLHNTGSFFFGCTFLGNTTFADNTSNAYYEFIGGYSSGAMTLSGGIDPAYFAGFVHDVAFGASLVLTTTANGTPTVQFDSAGLPPTYTGAPNLVYSSYSQYESYTPANSAKWANPQPTTVKEALDRIASVVGLTTPIP